MDNKKIKVNNWQELIAKAKEYKNSGGEWKLRERYIEMSTGGIGKRKNKLGWGIIIGNGKQEIDIFSCQSNIDYKDFVEKDLLSMDECNSRPELWQLFPEAQYALDGGSERNKSMSSTTCKKLKKDNEPYALKRYLVAENYHRLKKIIRGYFYENETLIYNSADRHFSNWAEIIDGQDGNMYVYVGEKKDNGGREIKIGIQKSEFEKGINYYAKERKIDLEVFWDLLVGSSAHPQTPAEKEESYRYLEEEFQEKWPYREKLCRKYWERMGERMKEKEVYWEEKMIQAEFLDKEGANKEFKLAIIRKREIELELEKNLNIKTCCDKDCPHYLPIESSPRPNSPQPNSKNNSISESDKQQLLQYFLSHNITKITLNNGQLKIEYSQPEHSEINSQELEKYRKLLEDEPDHSISLGDLQKTNPNSQNPTNSSNKLQLAIGASVVMLVGIIIFLLSRLRKNKVN
ncbi:MAG: hypothetical protein I3273_03825 [Candidatus Moeniiplasma glomeromycotorum]|nr:hypothetical protein [Candidatus Moeniiplasma glomeromycotorum]MCE8167674.1 hypothetical protein [Candidatus Moeniiplasma glomeromycotorum]MCE8169223.1 hypothetical protein [Candidatus Moeniiplasma glomeromycotorum]